MNKNLTCPTKNLSLLIFACISIMFFKPNMACAQERLISGVIIDENNEPLIGVSVVIKGTTLGITSDLNGRYKLSIAENQNTLVYPL